MYLCLLLLFFKLASSEEDHARAERSPQFNSWGLPQWGGAAPGTLPQGGGLLGGLLSQLGSQQGGLLGPMGQPAGRMSPRGPPPPNNNGGIVASIMRGIQKNQGGGILDIGRGITDELKALAGGPPPSNWQQHARKFCRRFPGHPKCRGGQMPLFEEISLLITEVADGGVEYLPRIPQLAIRDPLQGVPRTLAEIGRQLQYGHVLDGSAASGMQRVCRGRNCRQQTAEYSDKRTRVHSKLTEFEKTVYGKDTSEAIELRFGRVQQIKKALLEKAGIASGVEPANDGVFDKDILLTENQANFLLNELGKGGQGADPYKDLPTPATSAATRTKTMRGKRSSIFFEENPVQKWDTNTPIPYTLHSSLDEFDKNDIRSALQEISSKTCLRFQYVASPRTAHLNYMKVDSPTFCGLSYIGKVSPANPIYLSFQCGNSVGVAIHETMHALGVGHQHLRPDRDSYLQIDWSNVNPQHYDYFAVLDSKMYTSYGTPYAYDSIMHYNAYTAAVDISKPTMRPKFDYNNVRLLGQRDRMSVRDVEILKKMYCMPGCVDRNVYCGAWALKSLCNAQAHTAWMRQNCQKSCGFCTAG